FLLFLARITLRNQWLAVAAITALWMTVVMIQSTNPLIDFLISLPLQVGVLYILMRLRLLALIGLITLSGNPAPAVPISAGAWCLGPALVYPLAAIAVAAFAWHTSLAGRPLFGGDLLGDSAERKASGN